LRYIRLKAARGHVKKGLAKALQADFQTAYDITTDGADKSGYQFTPQEVCFAISF
jgi:hypothetical protein